MNKTLVSASVLLILGFTLACFFTFPSNDDFVYSGFIASKGVWATQIDHYMQWGGRFSSNFIISLIGLIDPTWNYYSFWSLGLVAMAIFSFWIMVKGFVNQNTFLFSLIITALFLARAPSITQLFYWMTGAIYYSIGIFASAIGIGLLYFREKKNSVLYTITLLFLTLIIVGNNEISLIGWQELLLSFIILKRLKTGKWDLPLTFIMVIGSVAGLFSLFAPGNFIRQGHFEKSGQVFRTLSNGVLHYFLFSVRLLSIPLIVLCIKFRKKILASVQILLNGINEDHAKKVIWLHWFLFLFTTSALAFWAMGRKPNTRSLNVVLFFYWLSFPFIMWWISKTWKKPMPTFLANIFSFIEKKWVPLTALTIFLNLNGYNLIRDYAINFVPYRREWLQTLTALRQGRGKDVVIYNIKVKAETTYFDDILAQDVGNLKLLFGVNSVELRSKEDEK